MFSSNTYCSTDRIFKLQPSAGIEIDHFIQTSCQLIQPLEDFFNNVFVMVVCSEQYLVTLLCDYVK